tara:strand:- start:302 stop:658 length:357 start_codon:yes stop_codon:yes gene_type:complete
MTSVVNDKNMLFARTETKCHELKVSPDSDEIMKVWIKEPTWLQVEQALSKIMRVTSDGEMDIDLNELYRFLVEEFIEKTEPSLNTLELMRLSPYIGLQLKEVLPNPFEDVEGDDTGKA